MSLSQWLRDYLYIPLGGSRLGKWQTYRNLFATMLLGGLWHGAAWNFVIWGSLHGAWLAGERVLRNMGWSIKGVLGWLVTFHIVCVAWVFFRANDLPTAFELFAGLGELSFGLDDLTWFTAALVVLPLASQFLPPNLPERICHDLAERPFVLGSALFVGAILATLWLAPSGTAPFIYFQF